jgi:hypothetical protein
MAAMKLPIAIAALVAVAGVFAFAGGGSTQAGGTSTGLVPLMDMGSSTYLGFGGGLYENGTNAPPADHAEQGRVQAMNVRPLATNGQPSSDGKIVLLSIGMSNTTQEFCSANSALPCDAWTFMGQAAADPSVNDSTLAIVNGAAGGQTATTFDQPTDPNYDRIRDTRLTPQGLTEAQVQVAWVKVADAGPTVSLPAANADAYILENFTGGIVRALKVRYPNIKLVFLSSRIYAGYATTTLNPEPYAYEAGFGAKWLVQAQIDQMRNGGTIVDPIAGNLDYALVPWVGWGPYLWADGLTPRSDGLTWAIGDFAPDGTHPAQSGREKVGDMLLAFFKSSPQTTCWFLASPPDIDGDGVANDCDPCPDNVDCDADGCTDGVELGPNQVAGGRRNPSSFWDFFDTPAPPNERDGSITVADIARIVARFGSSGGATSIADALSMPPAAPAYHAGFDRTLAGPNGWNTGAANGSITIEDISRSVQSFGHSCA